MRELSTVERGQAHTEMCELCTGQRGQGHTEMYELCTGEETGVKVTLKCINFIHVRQHYIYDTYVLNFQYYCSITNEMDYNLLFSLGLS